MTAHKLPDNKKPSRYEYSVLEWCQDLHMSKTGGGDVIYGAELAMMLAELTNRLVDWHEPSRAYDNAVRALVAETIREQIDSVRNKV